MAKPDGLPDDPRAARLLTELTELADLLDDAEKARVRRREVWCELRRIDGALDAATYRRVTFKRIAEASRRTSAQVIRDVRQDQPTDR